MKTPKNNIRPVIYHDVSQSLKIEMIVWSIRTLWYKSSAKMTENDKLEKNPSLKITAQTRRLIFQKSFYLVFRG